MYGKVWTLAVCMRTKAVRRDRDMVSGFPGEVTGIVEVELLNKEIPILGIERDRICNSKYVPMKHRMVEVKVFKWEKIQCVLILCIEK